MPRLTFEPPRGFEEPSGNLQVGNSVSTSDLSGCLAPLSPAIAAPSVTPVGLEPTSVSHSHAQARAELHDRLQIARMNHAMRRFQLSWPCETHPTATETTDGPRYNLHQPLKRVLSEFIRRSGIGLTAFVELFRGQTEDDYRPNKSLLRHVIAGICSDYRHKDMLLQVVEEGVRVPAHIDVPAQTRRPKNHGSCSTQLNVLRRNIRKEQDAKRCLVLDLDVLDLWPEVVISPFGVVPKSGSDPASSWRTIHDLSFPDGKSINDMTDQSGIPSPDYQAPAAIAREILRVQSAYPDTVVQIAAGDVASAFRHVSIHSASVRLFGGRIEEENALIIELSAPFGWTGSPGFCEVLGGAIAHVHGATTNDAHPRGFFSYHWVDDHVLVAPAVKDNLVECERSLRMSMLQVAGPAAANENKFTGWATSLKVLGLQFDTQANTVAMPPDKIAKARGIVAHAYDQATLHRTDYRSILGSLRQPPPCCNVHPRGAPVSPAPRSARTAAAPLPEDRGRRRDAPRPPVVVEHPSLQRPQRSSARLLRPPSCARRDYRHGRV